MTARLLAIETATAVTAVAVHDGTSITEVLVDDQRRHTEVLADAIAGVLAERGWAAEDLGAVVIDVGPGLFTGLRVGMATAKGLAVATGVGLHAVTSLDALAQSAADAGVEGVVACVVDARRREVFWSAHRVAGGIATALGDVALCTPGELAEALDALGELTVLGDGALRHRDALAGPRRTLRDDLVVPSPGSALTLVARRRHDGEQPVAHREVHPWYLRDADAVANFSVRATSP